MGDTKSRVEEPRPSIHRTISSATTTRHGTTDDPPPGSYSSFSQPKARDRRYRLETTHTKFSVGKKSSREAINRSLGLPRAGMARKSRSKPKPSRRGPPQTGSNRVRRRCSRTAGGNVQMGRRFCCFGAGIWMTGNCSILVTPIFGVRTGNPCHEKSWQFSASSWWKKASLQQLQPQPTSQQLRRAAKGVQIQHPGTRRVERSSRPSSRSDI